MRVKQIYKDYQIPINLQQHMLQVAALASIILDHWTGIVVDKKAVVNACLLHDIAKPIGFDLAKQALFGLSSTAIARLAKLQNRLKSQYGNDEHQVAVKICQSLGCHQAVVKIVGNFEWKYIPKLIVENNIKSLIAIYSDMRIGPKGILTLKQRLDELKKRAGSKGYQENISNGEILEPIIQKSVKTNLNLIKESQINSQIHKLIRIEI